MCLLRLLSAQPIAIVAVLALALSFWLASRLSKKIIEPINALDPDKPSDYIGKEAYTEIEPLLLKMRAQQNEIANNQAELEKTSQIRQEFTANASHELKTPLHAISGYAELLENGMVKQSDIRPFAGKIRLEAQRMTQLVGDIIDLTQLDGGADGMQWELCDLNSIAENAADSLRKHINELEAARFIRVYSGKPTREPNRYEFCLSWKLPPSPSRRILHPLPP